MFLQEEAALKAL
uniref:Ribosomal protein S24 mRNA n=1 Tax=Homo sapiens TaxID=9606 RepID=A2N8M3_HUMAN|nr:unknown protein [Homo sapiens]